MSKFSFREDLEKGCPNCGAAPEYISWENTSERYVCHNCGHEV